MLRGLAGLDDAQFRNLLKAEYFLVEQVARTESATGSG
jgi:hypothetical protein